MSDNEENYSYRGESADGEGERDDDDYEEEEEEEIELEADNPIVVRIKAAITTQLSTANTRVSEELRVKQEEAKRMKRTREDVGVELYGVQQQLARLQLGLETTHDNYNVMARARQQIEEDLEVVNETLEHRKSEVNEQKKKLERCQHELDLLNATLKQLDAYNEQMKSEIAVTRRATYKAEEAVGDMEKNKLKQDLYIDSINEAIKALQEQAALFEAQLLSQKQETKSAHDTLAEAAKEMESINFEKKQLMQQWQGSLLAMARRDEALKATEDALGQLRERELSIDTEVSGYKSLIRGEQQKNERLIAVLGKVNGESAFVEKQIRMFQERRQKLEEQYSMLKKSLDQTDVEVNLATTERKNLQDETEVVEKTLHKTMADTSQVEDTILNALSDQTTISKSAQSTAKNTEKLRHQIREKQNMSAQLQNELARIKVDALNTVSHNTGLKETLAELDAELKRKQVLIDKYELEIRRRNDDIEKKQRDVDRLNRKFDELTKDMIDENTGPLEATIHNLGKSITSKTKECQELQRHWIQAQTELVSLQNAAQAQSEQISALKAQHTILNQKRIRMEGNVNIQNKEVKGLEADIRAMHTDMAKLNDLISRNTSMQQALANTNFNLETEFVSKLRELEAEAGEMELKISEVKEERSKLLTEIVEAERQCILLQRKIELEQETQQSLAGAQDGSDVLEAMKKEIHRMNLRLSQLLRHQEEMLQELEKSIVKREDITIRGKAGLKSGVTKGMVKKTVNDLQKRVTDMENEGLQYEAKIRELEEERNLLSAQLADGGASADQIRVQEQELQNKIYSASQQKQRNMDEILKYQRMVKRYQSLEAGKFTTAIPADQLDDELDRQERRLQKVRDVINDLRGQDPSFAAVLEKLVM